jgi:hypothetical protein
VAGGINNRRIAAGFSEAKFSGFSLAIVSGVFRKRLFVTGNNGFLSVRHRFLTLKTRGNNTGNNGVVQRVLRGHILRF